MELVVIPTGSGKYNVIDTKDRKLYSVTKKRKLVGNSITTLHDASGYALYSMVRTESGKKPAFHIFLNGTVVLRVLCKSMFLSPCIVLEGSDFGYEMRGEQVTHFHIFQGDFEVGTLDTEIQTNGEPKYRITIEQKYFDDFFPLFAVIVDKCYGTGVK